MMTINTLPEGVTLSDLKPPKWDSGDREVTTLTLDHADSFGWCIRTLHIRRPGRRARVGATDRTYAIRVSDGAPVRIGIGPHVKRTITIYVRASRLSALQHLVDLRDKGALDANTIRDRISTRRAQGALRRQQSWW